MSSKAINASPINPQIDDSGHLKHFLTIEGLSKTQLMKLLLIMHRLIIPFKLSVIKSITKIEVHCCRKVDFS